VYSGKKKMKIGVRQSGLEGKWTVSY